jgi:hypothetical protein
MDTLITDFPGEDPTDTDIMEELKKKDLPPVDHDPGMAAQATLHLFPPQSGRTYHLQDRMTLDIDGKPETLKIDEWIRKDPVRLHATLKSEKFCLYRDAYDILMSKLRAEHTDYYVKIMRLNILIKIREQDPYVRASVPYDIEPLKFYQWWIKDEKKVHMSHAESIILFQKVNMINPRILLKRHEKMLRNRGE